jgi:hypothetical protein
MQKCSTRLQPRAGGEWHDLKRSHYNLGIWLGRLPRRPDKSGLLVMTNSVSTLTGGFILRAEASGADVDFSSPSLYHNRGALDIR